jgi:hypothetical protein
MPPKPEAELYAIEDMLFLVVVVVVVVVVVAIVAVAIVAVAIVAVAVVVCDIYVCVWERLEGREDTWVTFTLLQ